MRDAAREAAVPLVPVVPVPGSGPGPEKSKEIIVVPLVPVVPVQIDWSRLVARFEAAALAGPMKGRAAEAQAQVAGAPATADRDRFKETAAVLEVDMGLARAEAEAAAAHVHGFASAADLLAAPEAEPAADPFRTGLASLMADFDAMADPWRAEAWR